MPPAFTFGDKELTGFWYGKFESSNEEKQYTTDSSDLTPIIKPNITSWRNVKVVNIFYAALNMTTVENATKYGFSSDESIDTHVSKNSEWGAVAYLSQSKYGKYGNDGEEVYINNCSNFTTGIAGDTPSVELSAETCEKNTYETEQGQKASTTGNITGVYDMNGGAWERVMGALKDNATGKPKVMDSGFTNDSNENTKFPDAKYYDLYTSDDSSSTAVNLSATACSGGVCYGHALSETTGWYGDFQYFVSPWNSWLVRGATYFNSSLAGVFAFSADHGSIGNTQSFRIVLAP